MLKNKPHIHAELMRQAAEDAAETEKWWYHWQWRDPGWRFGVWRDCKVSATFNPNLEYRRKSRMININGHDVPEPYRGEMEKGQVYYTLDIHDSNGQPCCYIWRGDDTDAQRMQRGLVHLTPKAAKAHARALLSFTER